MSGRRGAAALGLAIASLAVVAGTTWRSAAASPPRGARQAGTPAITLLYQNFPNPFPTASSATTCVWFDLARTGPASLDVHDLRGTRVRRLFPRAGESATLPAGRYGRGAGGSGCDGRFTWDGTAEDGRRSPTGVYLLRLTARDGSSVRKIVFTAR
jgi:hypothetical protein